MAAITRRKAGWERGSWFGSLHIEAFGALKISAMRGLQVEMQTKAVTAKRLGTDSPDRRRPKNHAVAVTNWVGLVIGVIVAIRTRQH